MSELEEFFGATGRPHRGKGCPICRERVAALVVVEIREADKHGRRAGKGGRTRTASLSMCANHAVEAFRDLSGQVEKLRGGLGA